MGVGTIVTVNRVLSFWDRTAVRRAGYVIAAFVFFAGMVAYLNVRSEDSAAPAKVVPGSDFAKYGATIPLPKDAVATAASSSTTRCSAGIPAPAGRSAPRRSAAG